jgi:putative sigma-54 modulation protein
MHIKVHSIHFDADHKLVTFITDKLNKLELFHDRIMSAEVFLRLENSDTNENKVTEIKLNVPGKELFAKKQSKSFEESTDVVVEALRRQLRKHKGKVKSE